MLYFECIHLTLEIWFILSYVFIYRNIINYRFYFVYISLSYNIGGVVISCFVILYPISSFHVRYYIVIIFHFSDTLEDNAGNPCRIWSHPLVYTFLYISSFIYVGGLRMHAIYIHDLSSIDDLILFGWIPNHTINR